MQARWAQVSSLQAERRATTAYEQLRREVLSRRGGPPLAPALAVAAALDARAARPITAG